MPNTSLACPRTPTSADIGRRRSKTALSAFCTTVVAPFWATGSSTKGRRENVDGFEHFWSA
eukprot:3431346-Alexandrium_andersonii.AAC.1